MARLIRSVNKYPVSEIPCECFIKEYKIFFRGENLKKPSIRRFIINSLSSQFSIHGIEVDLIKIDTCLKSENIFGVILHLSITNRGFDSLIKDNLRYFKGKLEKRIQKEF